jgi:hypothetical protein
LVFGALATVFQVACGPALDSGAGEMAAGDIEGVSSELSTTVPRFPDDMVPVEIKNVNSGRCLSVPNFANVGGTVVQQSGCNGARNQQFFLNLAQAGTNAGYQIRTAYQGARNLAILGGSSDSGAPLVIWDTPGTGEEIFQLTLQADGSYSIVSANSGKCLDVPGASTADNVNIQQYDCHSASNQRWRITPLNTTTSFGMNLIAQHSGKCLDVAGGGTGAATIQQYDCLRQGNQHWRLGTKTVAGGLSYYEVIAMHSGQCMDVVGGSTANNAGVQQYPCTGGNNQKWRFDVGTDGYVRVINKASGRCLDIPNASTATGVALQQFTCSTTSSNQRFWYGLVDTRHVVVVEPAHADGTGRATQNDDAIAEHVNRLNGIYGRYGIRLVYDPATDKVQINSEGLYNINGNISGYFNCGDGTIEQPEICAIRLAINYPNAVLVISDPNGGGWSWGDSAYIGIGPMGITNWVCTDVPNTKWLSHEFGHYMGLAHTYYEDWLSDTRPDPKGDPCTNAYGPTGKVNGQIVDTSNVMSYYYNVAPTITPMQASIVRSLAYVRGY